MASPVHAVIPRMAIALGLPLAGLVGYVYWRYTRPYVVPPDTDIFAVVQGRWAWTTSDSGCANAWHRIAFSPDHAIMTITSAKPYKLENGTWDSVAVYDIRAHTASWIRGAIRGETRLTDGGRPVVWDLVLRSRDRYAWHRTDWVPGSLTREIARCDA